MSLSQHDTTPILHAKAVCGTNVEVGDAARNAGPAEVNIVTEEEEV